MTTPSFKLIRIDETNTNIKLNQNLDSIKAVLDTVTAQTVPVSLTSIAVTTGLNMIPHTLNKPLTGWYASRIRSQVDLWDSQDSGALPSIYLYLNASADCVIDIEVY
jgi:hypothetical protein